MARQNTQLESAGAEFLVLGNLLIECIPAFKSYTNMKGYDLVAVNAEKNLSARIQVKSRWRSKAEGFIINNFECDFVVIALLNRGSRDGKTEASPPEYFILPVQVAQALPRTEGWGKVSFSKFPDLHLYRNRWELIRSALKMTGGQWALTRQSTPFASLSGRCAMKPRSAGHFYVEWLLLNEVAKEPPSLLIS